MPVRWVVVLAAALVSCSGDEGAACGPSAGTVAHVVDGDTIVLASGERIRYLLVDTPESVNGARDCFGHEAAQLNRQLVEGRAVTLRYDGAQCRDRYARLLAYVDVDGREVNRLLVERGYACVLYIPPAGAGRHAELEALETVARQERLGMWAACQVVTCE